MAFNPTTYGSWEPIKYTGFLIAEGFVPAGFELFDMTNKFIGCLFIEAAIDTSLSLKENLQNIKSKDAYYFSIPPAFNHIVKQGLKLLNEESGVHVNNENDKRMAIKYGDDLNKKVVIPVAIECTGSKVFYSSLDALSEQPLTHHVTLSGVKVIERCLYHEFGVVTKIELLAIQGFNC
jgi:hypothetical protein